MAIKQTPTKRPLNRGVSTGSAVSSSSSTRTRPRLDSSQSIVGDSDSPRVLDHRHFWPGYYTYYNDLIGKKFGAMQSFVLVPECSLHEYPRSNRDVERKSSSRGCQSPCGNMWLAAIAFLFIDDNERKSFIKRNKSSLPGKKTIRPPSKNKYQTKVFLSELAARALAKAFVMESSLSDESEDYEDLIFKALWDDRQKGEKRFVRAVYCSLQSIPKSVRKWLYVLEDKSTGIQQWDLNDYLLNHRITDVSSNRVMIEEPGRNSNATTRAILSLAGLSPHGGSEGKFNHDGPQYEKVIGLLHSMNKEILEGGMIYGTRTAWIGPCDGPAVFLTDMEGSGRWYRLCIGHKNSARTVEGDYKQAFVRIVSGSPSIEEMSVRLGRYQDGHADEGSTRHIHEGMSERLPGIYLTGRSIYQMATVIGFSHRKSEGMQRKDVVVADPSSVPVSAPIRKNDKQKFIRAIPSLPYTRWACTRILLGTLSSYFLSAAILCYAVLDSHGIDLKSDDGSSRPRAFMVIEHMIKLKWHDVFFWLAASRLFIDLFSRFCIFVMSLCRRSETLQRAFVKLTCVRVVDSLMMGVPWNRKDRELKPPSESWWWRRLPFRARASLAVLFFVRLLYELFEKRDEAPGISAFIVGLVLGKSVLDSEGPLGIFMEEFCGKILSGPDMIRYIASAAVLDIVCTVLVCAEFKLCAVCVEPEHVLLLVAFVLESFLYVASLFRVRSLLRHGLDQETRVREVLESESPDVKLSSLSNEIENVADKWGLGGVANCPDVRGIMTLFERSGVALQARSPVKLADWVGATEAGGFKLYPILRSDGLFYEATDFEGELHRAQISNTPYYANIKLLFAAVDAPWTGTHYPVSLHPPSNSTLPSQDIDEHLKPGKNHKYVAAYKEQNESALQVGVLVGKTNIVPLTPPRGLDKTI